MEELFKNLSSGSSLAGLANISSLPTREDTRADSLASIAGSFQASDPLSAILKGVTGGLALTSKGKAQAERDIQNQKLQELVGYEVKLKERRAAIEQAAMAHAEAAQTGMQLAQGIEQAQLGDDTGIKNWLASSPASAKLLSDRIGVPVEGAKVSNINGVDVIQAYGKGPDGSIVTDPTPVPVDAYLKAYAPEAYAARAAKRLEDTAAQLEIDKLGAQVETERAQGRSFDALAAKRSAPSDTPSVVTDDNGTQYEVEPTKPTKPMPAAAVKLQNEELEMLGLANNITADIASLSGQIDRGDLQLGPVSNIANDVRNFTGKSTPDSRNLASFRATLEKMRNDSLRLNKGVQTEGDAVRAWNEMFNNINDTALVKQRLSEIQSINERAAGMKMQAVDEIRTNYGQPAMDYAKYKGSAAVGQGKTELKAKYGLE